MQSLIRFTAGLGLSIIAIFSTGNNALAQTPDTTARVSPPDTSQACVVITDTTKLEGASSRVSFTKGKGDAIDTLDIGDGRVQVVICDDNSWYYIRNLTLLEQDSLYTSNWEQDVVNPYKFPISNLPLRNTIVLSDSLSHWTCPYKGKVFSKFGYRHRRRHQGIDIPYPVGTPVRAAFDGKVRTAMRTKGYGNLVIIRHANGLETFYGHLSRIDVTAGQWVHSGDIIGLGGSTGRSTGPHLHFETRFQGFAFDPEWIANYEDGTLRRSVFVLKRSYLDPSSRYVPESLDEEDDVYGGDEKILEEEKRREAERAAMRWHTVRSGETLSHIAERYGKRLSTIIKLNPGIKPDRLRIGQKIRVN